MYFVFLIQGLLSDPKEIQIFRFFTPKCVVMRYYSDNNGVKAGLLGAEKCINLDLDGSLQRLCFARQILFLLAEYCRQQSEWHVEMLSMSTKCIKDAQTDLYGTVPINSHCSWWMLCQD